MAKVFPLLRRWVSQIGANSESRARIGFRSYSNRECESKEETEKERDWLIRMGLRLRSKLPPLWRGSRSLVVFNEIPRERSRLIPQPYSARVADLFKSLRAIPRLLRFPAKASEKDCSSAISSLSLYIYIYLSLRETETHDESRVSILCTLTCVNILH